MLKQVWGCGALLLLVQFASIAHADEPPLQAITRGIHEVLTPHPKDRDGVLTIHDRNLYVQCFNGSQAETWRCEAAGLEGQPWLHEVLTEARQRQLVERGFKPDAASGNFVRDVPRTMPPKQLAKIVLGILTELYGADISNIGVLADWLHAKPCHPRLRAGTEGGGSIWSPHWGFGNDADPGCQITTNTEAQNYDNPDAVTPGRPGSGAVDLDKRYGRAMALQIHRLEGASPGTDLWTIFEAGVAYVQCMSDMPDNRIYCEAVSPDAGGQPIARLLTSARRAKLIEAGFEPPAKSMNFSRFYDLAQDDSVAIAHALLAVFHDAYGYEGEPPLRYKTDGR